MAGLRQASASRTGRKPLIDWQDVAFRITSTFTRHRTPEALPILLHSKRVYVLPTRFGWFFGAFTLLMVLAALNYNNNMALMLTFLIAAFALLLPVYTVRNLVDLQITQASAVPVHAGELATFSVVIVNDHSKPRSVVWLEGDRGTEPSVSDIPGSGSLALSCQQRTTERGWMPMRRARLTTRFPSGAVFAWCWLHPEARCLVYPTPEENSPPLPRGGDRGTGRPERRGDEEWHGLREYQPGDPSRSIAWKVAARTDELTTKTLAQHESQRIELRYAELGALGLEARLSRLTRWCLVATSRNREYSLVLPDRTIGPGRGPTHLHACLRALAEF